MGKQRRVQQRIRRETHDSLGKKLWEKQQDFEGCLYLPSIDEPRGCLLLSFFLLLLSRFGFASTLCPYSFVGSDSTFTHTHTYTFKNFDVSIQEIKKHILDILLNSAQFIIKIKFRLRLNSLIYFNFFR